MLTSGQNYGEVGLDIGNFVLIIRSTDTVEDLTKLAFTMITRKRNQGKTVWQQYSCAVRKNQTTW